MQPKIIIQTPRRLCESLMKLMTLTQGNFERNVSGV